MKKIMLSIAVVIASLSAVNVSAQSQNSVADSTSISVSTDNGSRSEKGEKGKRGEKKDKDKKRGDKDKKRVNGGKDFKKGNKPGKKCCSAQDVRKGKPRGEMKDMARGRMSNGRDCEMPREMCAHKGDGNAKNIFAGIELNPDQKAKIEKLNKSRKDKHDKLRKESEKKHEKMSKKFDNDMKKILTPQQWAQFQANKAKMKAGKEKGMFDRRGRDGAPNRNGECRAAKNCDRPGAKKACCNKPANTTVSEGSVNGPHKGPEPVLMTK